jgi:hypothetical protein
MDYSIRGLFQSVFTTKSVINLKSERMKTSIVQKLHKIIKICRINVIWSNKILQRSESVSKIH